MGRKNLKSGLCINDPCPVKLEEWRQKVRQKSMQPCVACKLMMGWWVRSVRCNHHFLSGERLERAGSWHSGGETIGSRPGSCVGAKGKTGSACVWGGVCGRERERKYSNYLEIVKYSSTI